MEINRTDAFLLRNCNRLRPDQIINIRNAINELPQEKQTQIELIELRSPQAVFLCSYFLGMWGVDRFLCGQIGLGILKILTGGGLVIWYIIDWFTAYKRAQVYNCKKIMKVVNTL